MTDLLLGLATGVLFGALLQQGRVLRFEKQVGAMLLQDMTILKFMLSAIIVGMIGINLLVHFDLAALSVKPTRIGANLIGGLLFGAGWAVMGFCPGTAVGALGEGRWHAAWAILGMLVGAAVFAEIHPFLEAPLGRWGALGKLTLPEVLGIPTGIVIPAFVALFLVLFAWFEKRNL